MSVRPIFDLEIKRRKLRVGERTLIAGVLNVTPDSFSDGGRYLHPDKAIEHGLELARAGADWLDVGGESTRPGARAVTADEEIRRVLPVIHGLQRGLRRRFGGVLISVDTTKAEVAEAAVGAGASIINDISGLRFDPRLAEVARRRRTGLVLMHLRGHPETMQQEPFARAVWRSVLGGLEASVRRALDLGVRRSQLMIDPGLGFGKSRRQSFEILAHLGRLQRFRLPILVGTSRKSFVQAIVAGEGFEPARKPNYWVLAPRGGAGLRSDGTSARNDQALPNLKLGDAAAVAASVLAGAHIVRVHDVATVLPAVRIADAILKAGGSRLDQVSDTRAKR